MNLELYRRLLVHRADVFARQNADGSYTPVRRPVTDADLRAHLTGHESFGVYVIRPHDKEHYGNGVVSGIGGVIGDVVDTVHYVVFDLDTYDADALTFLCGQVERLVAPAAFQWWGPTAGGYEKGCLILEDSGGKGYHLWLFLSEPIPARQARAWTDRIRDTYVAAKRSHDLGGAVPKAWPPLEIFPKQDTVPAGGFGNLVKLPFGRHAKSGATSFLVPRPGWADSLEAVTPYPVALVPEAPVGLPRAKPSEGSDSSGPTRFGCVNRILSEGADVGNRDVAMLHLAHYARGCGLPHQVTEAWCLGVNADLFEPPMREATVRTKVASAYRMEAPHPSCGQDWLRDFCPGSETMRTCPNYTPGNGSPPPAPMDWR